MNDPTAGARARGDETGGRPARLLLVAHGLPPARIGGAELVTWRIARAAVDAGVEAAVFAPDRLAAPAGRLAEERIDNVRRFLVASGRPGDGPRAAAAFRRVLASWRPDVVWIQHLDGLSLEVGEWTVADGIPLAVTFHDYGWACPRGQRIDHRGRRCDGPADDRCPRCVSPGAPAPLRPALRALVAARWRDDQRRARAVLRAATARFAPSQHVARWHEAWLGAPVEPLVNPRAPLAAVPPGPAAGPLRVGFFGTLLPSKGVETLLEVQRRLGPRRVRLALHGPLPAGAAWRSWRRALRPAITAAGADLRGPYAPEQAATRLAGEELVAVPSRWEENAPLVLDEARAVRRFALVSRIGGLPELVDDPRVGHALPPDDLRAWTRALADAAALRAAGRALFEHPPPDPPAPDLRGVIRRLAGR